MKIDKELAEKCLVHMEKQLRFIQAIEAENEYEEVELKEAIIMNEVAISLIESVINEM